MGTSSRSTRPFGRRPKPVSDTPYKRGGTYVMYGRDNAAKHVTYIGRNEFRMHQFVDHKTGDVWTGYNPAVQKVSKR